MASQQVTGSLAAVKLAHLVLDGISLFLGIVLVIVGGVWFHPQNALAQLVHIAGAVGLIVIGFLVMVLAVIGFLGALGMRKYFVAVHTVGLAVLVIALWVVGGVAYGTDVTTQGKAVLSTTWSTGNIGVLTAPVTTSQVTSMRTNVQNAYACCGWNMEGWGGINPLNNITAASKADPNFLANNPTYQYCAGASNAGVVSCQQCCQVALQTPGSQAWQQSSGTYIDTPAFKNFSRTYDAVNPCPPSQSVAQSCGYDRPADAMSNNYFGACPTFLDSNGNPTYYVLNGCETEIMVLVNTHGARVGGAAIAIGVLLLASVISSVILLFMLIRRGDGGSSGSYVNERL